VAAGSAEIYRRLHRPHPEATFERLIDGVIAFRQMFTGHLWVEVMLVNGINDGADNLTALARHLDRIQPDEIHITLPTRPPSETWVAPPDRVAVMRAAAILGPRARVFLPDDGAFHLPPGDALTDAIVSLITRHPLRDAQLRTILADCGVTDVEARLAELVRANRAQMVERLGERFWSVPQAHFPDETHSRRTVPHAD
jgi:wyosine [tRNA(Phe)-imidazoG37] synthetase (radical SAM superfamily)